MLRAKRSAGHGSAQEHTGGVNRSFPLNSEELEGFGEGPVSLRAHGEVKDGHFHVHKLEKDDKDMHDASDDIRVIPNTQLSPG
jgi:hypothetical protein